jgi:hypothetical protein
MPARSGPGRAGDAVRADDRISGEPELDSSLTAVRQAAAGPRRRTAVATCRIVRSAPQNIWATAAGQGARCVACSTKLARVPLAVAVIEVPDARICLVTGICARCSGQHDRDLIAAAYTALRALLPSLRPIAPGGSA